MEFQQRVDVSGTSHFWSRSRRERVLGLDPGPGGKEFSVPVPVPSETNFGAGPSQKKKFGLGPAGIGTTLPISSNETMIFLPLF